ncbi:MAG: LacI family DNA-binding transcriptional regulator [Terrimicrobiaceae bacterium]|nr:LacI family DNA-binding transcriptional regulator [Terrimicrobiaceae bacterium]
MNILQFAKETGFSTATISRAFHEPGKLRPATREHILSVAAKLGYYPDPSGRALARGRHDVLGLIWPLEVEGADALFAQRFLAALTNRLVKKDLDLLICPVDRRLSATMAHAHRTLQRSRCDAWIMLYPRHSDQLIDSLERSRKPVVCFMGSIPAHASWKCVQLNQRTWLEDALRRLKAARCREVLLFGLRSGEPDHEERHAAFRELAPRYFGAHATSISSWPPNPKELHDLLRAGKVDAIIGIDDHAALLALDECGKAGFRVPEQVRIVGIDDIPEARTSSPALSTYRQPLDEMAGCAVDLATGVRQRSRLFDAVFVGRASLPPA